MRFTGKQPIFLFFRRLFHPEGEKNRAGKKTGRMSRPELSAPTAASPAMLAHETSK
jgi:hypothetical protein